jgi:hypothetical protein
MERTVTLHTSGRSNVFPASEGIGEALLQAVDEAEGWIAEEARIKHSAEQITFPAEED